MTPCWYLDWTIKSDLIYLILYCMGDNSVFPQLLCYQILYINYVIKYCVLKVKVVLVVFVMFCIDDNPLFGFLDQ